MQVFAMVNSAGLVINADVNWKKDYRKRLIDKLVLECKDEMLSATDTISIADKKLIYKNNCLINIIGNHVFNITSYSFYWLLLLLYKVLVKKRILKVILIKSWKNVIFVIIGIFQIKDLGLKLRFETNLLLF